MFATAAVVGGRLYGAAFGRAGAAAALPAAPPAVASHDVGCTCAAGGVRRQARSHHKPTLLDALGKDDVASWADRFDTWVFDCDGVLWTGGTALPGAAGVVEALRAAGKRVFLVTNNSTKSQQEFAAKLKKLGFPKLPDECLMSSAVSTARYLVQKGFKGKKVYVIGEPGLHDTFRDAGVSTAGAGDHSMEWHEFSSGARPELDPEVSAVVMGWCSTVNFTQLTYASMYIRYQGVPFIATNLDAAAPFLPDGTLVPGAGSGISFLATATSTEPVNCGKPSPTLADVLVAEHGIDTSRACMVGDRLDTDIQFGINTGMQQLLVLSGVTHKDTADAMLAGEYDGDVVPTAIASSIAVLLRK